MTTIEAVRADRLLDLAEKFLVANSPWDAIESASSASQLDGEARQRARQIISEATKLSWDTPGACPTRLSDFAGSRSGCRRTLARSRASSCRTRKRCRT